MALFTLGLISAGCDERIDTPKVNPSEEETVEVSLNIGIADEADAYSLSASTKANAKQQGAFDVELVPTVATRAEAAKPDQLYNLEIRQYNQAGDCYTSRGQAPKDQVIGQSFSVTLTPEADCQLVFVAWGQGNTSKSLGTVTLSEAQKVALDASYFDAITPGDMAKMPYVLHLKHVNVTSSGKITSSDGVDVRILLQRLATRLNISWDYQVKDYVLKQIILQSIPLKYKVVPDPDKEDHTYPSVMDQYTDIQLFADALTANSYSCWIPANVRGVNTASNAPQYRIKSNAPTGSSYASFIAVNSTDGKKKLNYRVYLGGKDYSDYNLNENTDYSYKINFKHTGLPVDDKRVTIIDPIPASENNGNFVPTANCFMVAPGAAFCFDPYLYSVNGDNTKTNTTLEGWSKDEGGIASVKLLWQTRENGDIGDPVMGVVNSSDDHTNIVDYQNNRIYCRVAPNTTGGSGAIAAYNKNGDILWSWHVWVTDYNPDPTGNVDVQTPVNKRKQKYTYGNAQLPIMDRNLGAVAGYNFVPASELDRSKANGFHYQWGRKDPFRSSYSNKKISSISVPSITQPIEGLLSLYEGDGITFYPMITYKKTVTYRKAYQEPQNLFKPASTVNDPFASWTELTAEYNNSWGMNGDKGLHDPCPAGWRVCASKNYEPLIVKTETLDLANKGTVSSDGGALAVYNGSSRTYIRLTGYWYTESQFAYIGTVSLTWCRNRLDRTNGRGGFHLRLDQPGTGIKARVFGEGGWEQEALLVRCIQERE